MTLITEKPEDLKPQNDLDDIEDPELNEDGTSIDRYLAFGSTPRAVPNPPKDDQIITYKVKVQCTGQAHKRRPDGEMRYRSELQILSVARVDEELPPDFVSKKEEERRAKEEAKAAAKGKGLYDDPNAPSLPGMPGSPETESDAEIAATMAAEHAAEQDADTDAEDGDTDD